MSPDTSAQDAPVASQEAEARESTEHRMRSQIIDGAIAGTLLVDALPFQLDAYAAVIRASERERYAGLRPLLDAIESAFSRFGEGSMGGSEMSRTERFAVLSEEVGEVAAEVVKEQRNRSREPGKHGPFDVEALIAELTQVAACAVMWAGQERAALAALEEAESA